MAKYEKTGYLTSHFKMFHLTDTEKINVEFHYHDFHKILIILQGNVSYCIEARTYDLKPGDIVFVNAGEVHKPILHDTTCYERIIIYISKEFLDMYNEEDNDLSLCFRQAYEKQSHVLRIPAFNNSKLYTVVNELEKSFSDDEYANELYNDVLFLQFMIQLNRASIIEEIEYIATSSSNPKIVAIIDYLNSNLTKDINIETLAETFYLSRYHLMHSFKEETGYTIGNYITTKRLIMAKDMIKSGSNVQDACFSCGFKSYSTFSRAYKKNFGVSALNDN